MAFSDVYGISIQVFIKLPPQTTVPRTSTSNTSRLLAGTLLL